MHPRNHTLANSLIFAKKQQPGGLLLLRPHAGAAVYFPDRMAWAGSLEEDYWPPPRATGHERALCICGSVGAYSSNNAQLYLPGCNHCCEEFERFCTFEYTGYRHRLDLDSPFGGLSPQPRTGM